MTSHPLLHRAALYFSTIAASAALLLVAPTSTDAKPGKAPGKVPASVPAKTDEKTEVKPPEAAAQPVNVFTTVTPDSRAALRKEFNAAYIEMRKEGAGIKETRLEVLELATYYFLKTGAARKILPLDSAWSSLALQANVFLASDLIDESLSRPEREHTARLMYYEIQFGEKKHNVFDRSPDAGGFAGAGQVANRKEALGIAQLLLTRPPVYSTGKIAEINDDNFQAEVLQSKIPVLVDFSTDWCPGCKMLAPVIAEVAGEAKNIKIVRYNTDEANKYASQYQISSIPHMIIFVNGQPLKGSTGSMSKDSLEQWIAPVVADVKTTSGLEDCNRYAALMMSSIVDGGVANYLTQKDLEEDPVMQKVREAVTQAVVLRGTQNSAAVPGGSRLVALRFEQ